MIISSKQNERIKRIASLKERKYRLKFGEYLVEGVKMVREAVSGGAEVLTIIGLEGELAKLNAENIELIETTEAVMSFICDAETSQGVCAVLKLPDTSEKFVSSRSVLLDKVADPGNMGTIIRTAAACGITSIYLIGGADPYSPKAVRSSMSGIFKVKICTLSEEEFLSLNVKPLIAADMTGENIFTLGAVKDFCIMMGSEAHGLSDALQASADKVVSIPMQNGTESLNVGVSFGVIAYTLINKV